MIQRGDGVRFALEAAGELPGGGFDRDVASQPGVARFPDFAYASAAEARDDFLGTELFA